MSPVDGLPDAVYRTEDPVILTRDRELLVLSVVRSVRAPAPDDKVIAEAFLYGAPVVDDPSLPSLWEVVPRREAEERRRAASPLAPMRLA